MIFICRKKNSRRRAERLKKRALMREIRKRAEKRKDEDNLFIFD